MAVANYGPAACFLLQYVRTPNCNVVWSDSSVIIGDFSVAPVNMKWWSFSSRQLWLVRNVDGLVLLRATRRTIASCWKKKSSSYQVKLSRKRTFYHLKLDDLCGWLKDSLTVGVKPHPHLVPKDQSHTVSLNENLVWSPVIVTCVTCFTKSIWREGVYIQNLYRKVR